MKLIILLVVFAWSNAAKLDKTYLPPSSAQTSGGSGNFLQTPISGPSNDYQRSNDFSQRRGPSRNGFPQNRNDYTQANNFAGTGNGLARNGNDFAQNGQDFSQNNNYAQGANDFTQSGNFGNFEGRPERTQAAFERNAAILRQDTHNDGEVYSFAYETENGIVAEENGVATNGVEAQGGFSYTGDDGQVYSIRYTADQNGFVPQGDHLPTPPPIPEEILKALEQNARDEAAGIYDDGSYNEAKYESSDNGNYNGGSTVNDNGNNFNGNTFNGNNFNGNNANGQNFNNGNIEDDEDTIVTNNALLRSGNQAGSNGAYNQGFRNQHVGNHDARPVSQGAGLRNQGSTGNHRSGVNNAYLPPFATQRGQNNGRGFGRRQPSFNDKNGYQY